MPLIKGDKNKDNKNIGNRNAGMIGDKNAPGTAPGSSGIFIDGNNNRGNTELANDNQSTGHIGDDNTGGSSQSE